MHVELVSCKYYHVYLSKHCNKAQKSVRNNCMTWLPILCTLCEKQSRSFCEEYIFVYEQILELYHVVQLLILSFIFMILDVMVKHVNVFKIFLYSKNKLENNDCIYYWNKIYDATKSSCTKNENDKFLNSH
jgi:hypothetical protein